MRVVMDAFLGAIDPQIGIFLVAGGQSESGPKEDRGQSQYRVKYVFDAHFSYLSRLQIYK